MATDVDPRGRRATRAGQLDDWLPPDACAKNHIDPYAIWALHTNFRHLMRGNKAPKDLEFLVELKAPFDPRVHRRGRLGGKKAKVPRAYEKPIPGSDRTSHHITMRLPFKDLRSAIDATADLMFRDDVLRAQIGVTRPVLRGDDPVPPPASDSVDARPPEPPKVVLGVLEDACPFGHASLLTPQLRTRVVALWDQSATAKNRHDPAPADWDYGRQRLHDQLNALLDLHRHDGRIDEEALYRNPAALQPRLRGVSSHAAAVITLLAGNRNCLPSIPCRVAQRAQDPTRQEPDAPDAAAQAPLVVVQLPREEIDIAGSRWFTVHALDGLRYIMDHASQLHDKRAPVPLIVNVSYGSVAGAHDGTALLESAMAELSSECAWMQIVLSAGNAAGNTRREDGPDALRHKPRGYHAVIEELKAESHACLQLYVPPNKATETYLEIWFQNPGSGDHHQTPCFLGARDVRVRVESPAGDVLNVDRLPGADFDAAVPMAIRSGLLCFSRVAQSKLRSMALLVVSATETDRTSAAAPSSATKTDRTSAAAPSGLWTVTLHNTSPRTLRVEAWVERELVPRSGRAGPSARLVAKEDPAKGGSENEFAVNDENTINNIATGPGVTRVGALVALGSPDEPTVSPYSSQPAAGARAVEWSAPADETPAVQGIRVSGNLSGSVIRMNGTSVAAPQAARWLANRAVDGFVPMPDPKPPTKPKTPRRGRTVFGSDT